MLIELAKGSSHGSTLLSVETLLAGERRLLYFGVINRSTNINSCASVLLMSKALKTREQKGQIFDSVY